MATVQMVIMDTDVVRVIEDDSGVLMIAVYDDKYRYTSREIVCLSLTPALKSALRQKVRDWEFEDEAALHDELVERSS